MTDKGGTHTTEVIGSSGRYHTLAAFTFLMISGISGAEIYYVQFLAPKIVLYWDWDADSPNRTNFDSDCCKMDQIMWYNSSSPNSTSTSKLIYETPYSRNSLTETLDLVCEHSWMISLLKSLTWIAVVVGNIFLGPLTEKYGRKRCLCCLIIFGTVCNTIPIFAKSYVTFALPFLLGSGSAYSMLPVIMALYTEIVPDSRRQYLGPMLQCGLCSGMCLVAGAAWIFRNWIYTQLVLTLYLASILPLVWFMEESPSWLMLKGRDADVKAIVLKMAKMNDQKNDDTERKADMWMDNLKAKQNADAQLEKGTFLDLFKNKVITKYTICLILAESTALFCTQGIFLNVEAFGSGLFVDFFITNAVTLVSLPLLILCVKLLPVKHTQILYFILLGLVCATYPFVYVYSSGRMAITILGRAISAAVTGVNTAYTAEVFPTSVRVIGQAFVMSFSRIFVAVAPFSKELGERTTQYVPFILFSTLSFFSVIMFFLLPNTRNRPLVHTVQELKRKKIDPETRPTIYTISTKL